VLGWSAQGLEPLAVGARFRPARHGGSLATGTFSQILGPISRPKGRAEEDRPLRRALDRIRKTAMPTTSSS
jgi:hypothetical protein